MADDPSHRHGYDPADLLADRFILPHRPGELCLHTMTLDAVDYPCCKVNGHDGYHQFSDSETGYEYRWGLARDVGPLADEANPPPRVGSKLADAFRCSTCGEIAIPGHQPPHQHAK